jgi:hypothetical protein
VTSLRNIKPTETEETEDLQWEWRTESKIELQNPDGMEELLSGEACRSDYDITGRLASVDMSNQ